MNASRATLHDLDRALESYRLALHDAGITYSYQLEIVRTRSGGIFMAWDEDTAPDGSPTYLGMTKSEALENLVMRTTIIRALLERTHTP